jgi:hypothetical protein
MPGPYSPQPDLQRHTPTGAAYLDRASQSVGHITAQIARAEFARLGKVSDLFDRAPTRIERLKDDPVSRINRKGGCQIARDKPVYTLFGPQMMKLCHFALPSAIFGAFAALIIAATAAASRIMPVHT